MKWETSFGIIAHAERDSKFTMNEVLDHIHQKFTERKPHLLEERHISIEEETKIWHEVKDKQKNGKNKTT